MAKRWHKWTKSEHRLLLRMYKKHGDTAIAAALNETFPKGYQWTKKHVYKRRNNFRLKRTKQEEHRLRVLNNGDGRQYKMWDTRGRVKEGEIRRWGKRLYIKVNGKCIDYFRHIAAARKGQVVRSHEGNVTIITRRENQLINAKQRASLPPELKKTIRTLNQLKKLIYGKEHSGS